MDWFVGVLKSYPEIAIFLSLAIGFWIGSYKIAGFSLGGVTGTLLAGVLIGQLGLSISPNVKSTFFILFIFAVGYGVGPQFMRAFGKDGPKQMLFAVIVVALCLISSIVAAQFAGLELGYAAGLFSGSQTISAVIGVATDQINQLGLPPEVSKPLINQIPIAYAVTYIFGTIGTAWFLAQLGPKLTGIDLAKVCADYEKQMSGGAGAGEPGVVSARRNWELRAYLVAEGGPAVGRNVGDLERLALPDRVFVERIRRSGAIFDATTETVLRAGDVVAVAGPRAILVERLGAVRNEVDDVALLDVPAEALDVFVAKKGYHGATLRDLAKAPFARGVYVRKITRGGVEIPVLAETEIFRGDIVTIIGGRRHVESAVAELGYADRPTETTNIAFLAAGITVGGLIGALSIKLGGIPIGLSTTGGALLAGLALGWLRSVHPTFGGIPGPALWVLNTIGLNVFIAVVGISAGPGFVAGLREVGISLFLWGIFATLAPMVAALYLGHYVFKFHPALLLGVIAGSRTTTAALGMIQDAAKSKIPALGYGAPYAVGNTLLTICGLIIVLLLH
ncbi:aspartate-alanine antiporter [Hansschlegelia zhihuaiae]|uniref:Aspartate-alanine antiporter n=1 Tax=Hansschlegelia zhihuaiae TaxID=405005 RepID=A0A4Q0M5B6_9HYPH|nr:aspartate-alanine antiporter [Hansschlegelia zhihuaiae]RXF67929.1 aspartate-alanine antiporter [Hansschlegelia zhihuaiae]